MKETCLTRREIDLALMELEEDEDRALIPPVLCADNALAIRFDIDRPPPRFIDKEY